MSRLSVDVPQKKARRKRVLLLATAGPGASAALDSLAGKLHAFLQVCTSIAEVRDAAIEHGESISLAVFDGNLPELLGALRAVHKAAPPSELIILATAEEGAILQKQFGPAPRIGTNWRIAAPDAPGFLRQLESAFVRADQRKATRTTLDRFNARLSSTAQNVDTRELRQLVISDRFLSSILESAFDAVLLVDSAGKVAAFNPSAEKLFRKTRQEVQSSSVYALADEVWAEAVARSMASQQTDALNQSAICVNGSVVHVEISATPVFDTAGNQIAKSLIVRDITLRMLSEQALRTNEKLAAVGRLASSIAHEINNPLESVTNLLYLARQTAETPQMQEYLDLADQELRRVSNITSQTLRFHKQATSPREVTCEDLIEGALAVFQGRTLNSKIQVEKRKRTNRTILCFEGEIRQVLNNLIGNAIDVMPGGGRLLLRSRETTLPDGKQGLVITVADNGGGMSPKTVARIFEPFFTTKGIGGTGLGLWISREIVLRHNGQLSVRSSQWEAHSGTVFKLVLPLDAAPRSGAGSKLSL